MREMKKKKSEPKTHDYSNRYWGHDYAITKVEKKGQIIHMTGWGFGLKIGDYIIIQGQSNELGVNPTTRYLVAEIKYESDPKDMWHGIFLFAPRPNLIEA